MVQVTDLFFNLGVIITGFFILAKSSDLILYSLSDYAKRLRLSVYVIGFTAISLAGLLPELIASLTGAIINKGEVVFGTVFGSNIFMLPMLGIVLLFGKNVKNDMNGIGNAPIITLLLTILPFVLVFDNYISRADGVILIFAYVLYLYSFLESYRLVPLKKKIKITTIYRDAIVFLGSLFALFLSARFLITHTIYLSEMLNISLYIVVLLIMGAATSLPDMMLQFRAVIKNREKLAIGYVLGAIVANSTLVLGVTAFLNPISIDFNLLKIIGVFLVIGTILSIVFMNKEELNWRHGIIFILLYLAFLVCEIIF